MGQSPKIAATVLAISGKFGDLPPLVIDSNNRVIYGDVPALRATGAKRWKVYRCKLDVADPVAQELRVALLAKFGPDS
jgi:hypothetical protein